MIPFYSGFGLDRFHSNNTFMNIKVDCNSLAQQDRKADGGHL